MNLFTVVILFLDTHETASLHVMADTPISWAPFEYERAYVVCAVFAGHIDSLFADNPTK